jgi:hypothetical protein
MQGVIYMAKSEHMQTFIIRSDVQPFGNLLFTYRTKVLQRRGDSLPRTLPDNPLGKISAKTLQNGFYHLGRRVIVIFLMNMSIVEHTEPR